MSLEKMVICVVSYHYVNFVVMSTQVELFYSATWKPAKLVLSTNVSFGNNNLQSTLLAWKTFWHDSKEFAYLKYRKLIFCTLFLRGLYKQSRVYVVVVETLLPWQQRYTFIHATLLFEVMWSFYLGDLPLGKKAVVQYALLTRKYCYHGNRHIRYNS